MTTVLSWHTLLTMSGKGCSFCSFLSRSLVEMVPNFYAKSINDNV